MLSLPLASVSIVSVLVQISPLVLMVGCYHKRSRTLAGTLAGRPGLAPGVLLRRHRGDRGGAQRPRRPQRPAAVHAHAGAPADRRHRLAADRARADRAAAGADAADLDVRPPAGADPPAGRLPAVGRGSVRVAHPLPLPGGPAPPRRARARARDVPRLRDPDVDAPAGAAAHALVVRQPRQAALHRRRAPHRHRAGEHLPVVGDRLLPVLPARRRAPPHLPAGRPEHRRRGDDGGGVAADAGAVLLAVPEGRQRGRGAPGAARLRQRQRPRAERGARRAGGGRRARRGAAPAPGRDAGTPQSSP